MRFSFRRRALALASASVVLVTGIGIGAVASATTASAAERAYFRIMDHPRVEQVRPGELKTRIDAVWDPKQAKNVRISIQLVRLSGSRWVAAGKPVTLDDVDGNLTVFAEGKLSPGRHVYAAQWNADAIPPDGKGMLPYKRPNERGPGREFTAPGAKVAPRPAPPVISPGAMPSGCSHQVVPFKSHSNLEAATGYVIMDCPSTRSTRVESVQTTTQRCNLPHAGGILPCGGWHKIGSKTRVLPGSTAARVTGKPWLDSAFVLEVTIPTDYDFGNVRHRLNAQLNYEQLPHPPRTHAILRYNAKVESFLRGDYD